MADDTDSRGTSTATTPNRERSPDSFRGSSSSPSRRRSLHTGGREGGSGPDHNSTNSNSGGDDALPALSPQERKHSRVLNCLTQLESLNLERPEGMVVSRRAEDVVRKLPKVAQSPNGLSAREKAIQYHEDIEEMIELHREFSRSNQRLWKKVTRAVQVVSNLYVKVVKRAPRGRRDPDLHDEIASAFNTHQEEERQRLKQVKSAFQLLKDSGDSSKGRIKKSKMDEILKSLGVDQILEVARKKEGAYSMSIMERVNLCADYWLEKADATTKLVNFGNVLGDEDAAVAAAEDGEGSEGGETVELISP